MEKCFDCYAEYGFSNVGIKGLGKACGFTSASLYVYFENLDDLVIQSTEYCMSRVEDELLRLAPRAADDLERFLDEVPRWTARTHGKKYRLMYQIYTDPKYREHGRKFFEGVDKRCSDYAESLAGTLGVPSDVLRPMIFVFVRACVHYALYEDEFCLHEQLCFLKQSIALFCEKYGLPRTTGAESA